MGLKRETDSGFDFPPVRPTGPGCTESSWDCYWPPNGDYILWPSDFEQGTSHPERVRYVSVEQQLDFDRGDWNFDFVFGWPKPDPYTGNYWGASFYSRTDQETSFAQAYKWIGQGVEVMNVKVEIDWQYGMSITGAAGDPTQAEPSPAPTDTRTDLFDIELRFVEYHGFASDSSGSEEFGGVLLSRPKGELLRCVTRSSSMTGTWHCSTEGDFSTSDFSWW